MGNWHCIVSNSPSATFHTFCRYIMVVGKYPFSGSNVYTLYESISKGEYAIPDTLDPLLRDLIQGILQIDPRRRLTIQQIREHVYVF